MTGMTSLISFVQFYLILELFGMLLVMINISKIELNLAS